MAKFAPFTLILKQLKNGFALRTSYPLANIQTAFRLFKKKNPLHFYKMLRVPNLLIFFENPSTLIIFRNQIKDFR